MLFSHESRSLKYSVKVGRITLAWLLANHQKNQKSDIDSLILLSVNSPFVRFFHQNHHLKPQ
jgi:hypothetical protein